MKEISDKTENKKTVFTEIHVSSKSKGICKELKENQENSNKSSGQKKTLGNVDITLSCVKEMLKIYRETNDFSRLYFLEMLDASYNDIALFSAFKNKKVPINEIVRNIIYDYLRILKSAIKDWKYDIKKLEKKYKNTEHNHIYFKAAQEYNVIFLQYYKKELLDVSVIESKCKISKSNLSRVTKRAIKSFAPYVIRSAKLEGYTIEKSTQDDFELLDNVISLIKSCA